MSSALSELDPSKSCLVPCDAALNTEPAEPTKLWNLVNSVVSSIFSVFGGDASESPPAPTGAPSPATLIESCDRRLLDIFTQLSGCPETAELMDAVGEVRTLCTEDPSIAPLGAACFPEVNGLAINVNAVEAEEMGKDVLFELINLVKREQFINIGNTMCSMGREAYVKAVEGVEYLSTQTYHTLTDVCIRQNFLPDTWARYSENLWPTLQDYLSFHENGGHTDTLRIHWHQACAPEKLAAFIAERRPFWESRLLD